MSALFVEHALEKADKISKAARKAAVETAAGKSRLGTFFSCVTAYLRFICLCDKIR